MSDLISRSAVIDIIHRYSCNTARIEENVLDLPTAYDISKVVAELKKNKVSNVDLYDENNESWNDDIVSFDTTINIVRRGGVE